MMVEGKPKKLMVGEVGIYISKYSLSPKAKASTSSLRHAEEILILTY